MNSKTETIDPTPSGRGTVERAEQVEALEQKAAQKATKSKRDADRRPDGELRARNVTLPKGTLALERHGQEWAPVACGPHRSVEPYSATKVNHEVGTHLGRRELRSPQPVGFQPKCKDCIAELESTLDHADRYGTV